MAKRREDNLIPLNKRSKSEQRKIQAMGGKRSGEVRKEKKLMSMILSDILQKEHEIVLRDDEGNEIDRESIPASELIERTVVAIMNRADSASVSMIKTIGELTEGKNINLSGMVETSALSPQERKARIEELERKRADGS